MVADVLSNNNFRNAATIFAESKKFLPVAPPKKILDSSIASNTSELLSMQRQEAEGRPVSLYEFGQNLVDYSVKERPLICLNMADGTSQIYSGHPEELKVKEDDVDSISFVSFGEGMDPSDIILFSHGGGEGTLGVNGRGGSIAYTYCVSEGMGVQIASTRGGEAFVGNIKMVDVPSKKGLKRMVFEYQDSARIWRDDERITEVKVLEPNFHFIDSLGKLSEIFLHANPKYSSAKLVTPDADAVSSAESIKVWASQGSNITVDCLLGLPESFHRETTPQNSIFVGALKVATAGHENFALPWAIWGGEHSSRKQVTRSKDSRNAEGSYRDAIKAFILNTSSEKILEKILDVNEKWVNTKDIFLKGNPPEEISMFYHNFGIYDTDKVSEQTTKALTKILKRKYGDSLPIIAVTSTEADELKRKFGDSRNILQIASPGFSFLLESTGCEFYKDVFKIQENQTRGMLNVKVLSEEKTIDALAEIAGGKMLKTYRDNSGTTIRLEDKGLLEQIDFESFLGLPDTDSKLQKLISALGFFTNIGYDISLRLVKGDRIVYFNFDSYQERDEEVSFSVKAKAVTDTSKDLSEGLQLKIRNDHLNKNHEDYFLEAVSRKMSKSNNLEEEVNSMSDTEVRDELLRLKKEKFLKEKEKIKIEKTLAEFKDLVNGKVSLKDWLSEIPSHLSSRNGIIESISEFGVHRLGENMETFATVETNGIGISLADYYRSSVTDSFLLGNEGQVLGVSEEKWELLSGTLSSPTEWQIATTINVGRGWTNIPIKREMNDITYLEHDGLEVVIDKKNRVVRARSNNSESEEVKFYQRNCENGLFIKSKPESVNYQVDCSIKDINEPLASKLKEIRDDKKMSLKNKNTLVTILHKESFIYSDNPEIQNEVMKNVKKIGEFESNLVNIGSGICNYSAARLSIMKRLCGLPTRIEGGVVTSTKELKLNHTHAWPLSWDGKNWYEEESTHGVVLGDLSKKIDPINIYGSRMEDLLQAGFNSKVSAAAAFFSLKDEVVKLMGRVEEDNFHKKEKKGKINPVVERMMRVAIILAADSLTRKSSVISEKQKRKLIGEG